MAISLSGLNLDFLRKEDPNRIQPGRYRYDIEEGVIPANRAAHKKRSISKRGTVATPYFAPDVDAIYGGSWRSIVDGTEISSRSNWREHNRRNQVVDVGDKFWSPDGDDAKTTREKMGYDPSLIGDPSFSWGKRKD
jgi:hypothetical protein